MTQKGESMIPSGYTLVRPISEGAFGRVLEIEELSTGQSYALKLIPRLTEADQKRGEREVALLERFRDARIVGLHKSVVMKTYHGIVMDLGSRNLKDLMLDYESQNKSIPLEVAVLICIDIAEGLCVMHTHPIHPMAHGDLKPENILLTKDNRAMLCDLGAADASGMNTTRSASEIGTYEYNSPERLDDNQTKGTPASDIWSLGVIVYRIVTGKPLFGGGSLSKIVQAIMNFDESKLPSTIPEDIRAVLVKMLAPNPASRLTATQLFHGRELERMLGAETPLSKMKDLLILSASRQPKQKTQNEENSNLDVLKEEEEKNRVLFDRNTRLRELFLLLTPEKTRECIDVNTIGNSRQDSAEEKAQQAENGRNKEVKKYSVLSAMLPSIWPHTESITSFDAKVHKLTDSSVFQTMKLGQDWRTVFTFGLIAGEWELTISVCGDPPKSVLLGFLRFPLPDDCFQNHCGKYEDPIGGDFDLSNGRMWSQGRELMPAGTNRACTSFGQTATIRVNLTKHEAHLRVSDKKQPGFFRNIPAQVCLGISTEYSGQKSAVQVLHLRRLDESSVHRSLSIQLNTPNCFFGTSSLQKFDAAYHTITTTSIVPLTAEDEAEGWRSVLTFAVTQGVWELKVRASFSVLSGVNLGYVNDPLPSDVLNVTPGDFVGGKSGSFILRTGQMWKGGKEFKPVGTNKMCKDIGQTAAIRVDMARKEATLFVDDAEQPGVFPGLSGKVFLCISTNTDSIQTPVEVMWLKRVDVAAITAYVLPPQTAPHTPLTTLPSKQQKRMTIEDRRIQKQVQRLQREREQDENKDEAHMSLPPASIPPSTGLTIRHRSTADTTLYEGTSALARFDRSCATLSPSVITFKATDSAERKNDKVKTFLTKDIAEGEWELKIKGTEDLFDNILLGYFTDTFMNNPFNTKCGADPTFSSGGFELKTGQIWKGGKFTTAILNKTCGTIGQTVAIRVNMSTREARLVVDDVEQPDAIKDIPIKVRLAISHANITSEFKIMLVHLKRLDPAIPRQPPQKLENAPNFWPGTNSLEQFTKQYFKLTPTQLIQTSIVIKGKQPMALTFPIEEGEWELKIRVNHSALERTFLGFTNDPFAGQETENSSPNRLPLTAFFHLPTGRQYFSTAPLSDKTNRPCNSLGQTAAIRVNMEKREAKLFVDDEEQPHTLDPLPDVLHLFIRPSFDSTGSSLEVMWLKKLCSTTRHSLPPNTPTCLYGTSCLQTLPPPFMIVSSSILSSIVPAETIRRPNRERSVEELGTAYTKAITEGEWELKIRRVGSTLGARALVFHHHPLPPLSSPDAEPPKKGDQFHFDLIYGNWREISRFRTEEFEKNKTWGETGQTAAIRVDMTLRTATLFIDEEKQPFVYSDLPDCVYLGITHPSPKINRDSMNQVEVIWLKRLDDLNSPTPQPLMEGIKCLKTICTEWDVLSRKKLLSRGSKRAKGSWRTVFTGPITEGLWELEIEKDSYAIDATMLGFVSHPLPDNATQRSCGDWPSQQGGGFYLEEGSVWTGGHAIHPPGSNNTLHNHMQHMKIVVDMQNRQAWLVFGFTSQQAKFENIPQELCLAISHRVEERDFTTTIVHLKRLAECGSEVLPAQQKTLPSTTISAPTLPPIIIELPFMLPAPASTRPPHFFFTTPPPRTQDSILGPSSTPSEVRADGIVRETAYTGPITEGVWELKIKSTEQIIRNLGIGYLRHPLPPAVSLCSTDFSSRKLGGEFLLSTGGMCSGNGLVKPVGTNTVWDHIGQTAAIRVNMSTREARLFVDDQEQPGIFTDIPIQVFLGIALDKHATLFSVEVIHLKRLSPAAPHPFLLPSSSNLTDYWPGTNSLETLDSSIYKLTPTQLVQVDKLESTTRRTVFTFPIQYGEWELKIRANHTFFENTYLGYLRYPLPPDATQVLCEEHHGAIGGDFGLMHGDQKREGFVLPKLTNRQCNDVGQTAAIRVNMEKREARLFVDDQEQPHPFCPLPDVVCLAISTGFDSAGLSLEVMWLKKLRSTPMHSLPFNSPTCIHGTSCLRTFSPAFISHSSSLVTVMKRDSAPSGLRTAFTYPVARGEWEFRIKPFESEFEASALGFISYPLPTNSTEKSIADCELRMSGAFLLKTGQTISAGSDVYPTVRNDVWNKPGQSAAIRVNMDRREAVLFLDDVEQNGIFTDIPSPLCFALTVEASDFMRMIEIVHFKQLPPSKPVQRDRSTVLYSTGKNTLAILPQSLTKCGGIWSPKTALITAPIKEGVWEWRIRIPPSSNGTATLGFLANPILNCSEIKECGLTIGQTGEEASIRVDMEKREARLFLDGEEQPEIFKDIPVEVRLALTHKNFEQSLAEGIVHLKRLDLAVLRPPQKLDNTPNFWPGTNSLQTIDTTAHELTPTRLVQIVRGEAEPRWRTAFTFPIDEGEWELSIRSIQIPLWSTRLCFASAPLPDDSGSYFDLWTGNIHHPKQSYPYSMNVPCQSFGQTAAIRVNMSTREARLFVDDKEQPGVIPDIPSPLCLGICTAFSTADRISLEVLGLKKLPPSPSPLLSNTPTCLNGTSCLPNLNPSKVSFTPLILPSPDDMSEGTRCLQTLDKTSHHPSQLVLSARVSTPKLLGFRTAFTAPLTEGEWELKIRGTASLFANLLLGYLKHPLRPNATQKSCGSWSDGTGGGFVLKTGQLWKGGEYKPEGTNKKCIQAGQTAAIRVNMSTKEARLVVDDEEQPGIFTDIPSPLCLALTTAIKGTISFTVEVLWLKRL
ncbi:putative serine/threonine protein kinase [Blattamonas nauphoetae]|uniref:non-specific serine/threonine protein kinase n=1 Tax=Blattamonas nauphoetae TaxID=2049346 RepID=A0ABQ9X4Z0_9EUKA|nr:putative serine/threonine protein kinase [Blattamonas nauphoetae]